MKKTSWGKVADWYDDLLDQEGTFQSEVILPNLLRVINIKNGESILDVACGQGYFTRNYADRGAKVIGCDISEELINLAKGKNTKNVEYIVTPADKLNFAKNEQFDKVSMVLALQNMENMEAVIKEISRVVKKDGKVYFVLNHPAFRIPKKSDWGFDESKNIQYRKVETYLSEVMTKIDMNPGEEERRKKIYTFSFHKPIRSYFWSFFKNGFMVSGFEEWISNRKSEDGPRQVAEDKARKEIPMFMLVELTKV